MKIDKVLIIIEFIYICICLYYIISSMELLFFLLVFIFVFESYLTLIL